MSESGRSSLGGWRRRVSWGFGLLFAAGFLVALQEAPSVAGVSRPPSGHRAERVASTGPARLPGAGRSPAGSMDPATGRPPPFDVGAVIEQVHFAFRPDGAGWRAGHSTWAVRYEDGALDVQPFHFPGGRPGEASPGATGEGSSARPSVVRGDPVRFGSAEVTRGGLPLAGGAGAVVPTDRGQLDVVTGTVTEQLRNGPKGVEQSWVFAEPPGGSGELVVRVPVTAGRLIGETEAGLHLSAGALAVRYGHGTWVDAEGNRTAIPARWDDEAIALRVPAEVLEASTFPAILDPVISPEIGMDAPVYGPADNGQSEPAIAAGDGQHLVVWRDGREDANWDVFAARVLSDGTVADPAGIGLASGPATQTYPAVAWNGSLFLACWEDASSGTSQIACGRVGDDGVALEPGGRTIAPLADGQYRPAVASDGTGFLVAWQRSNDLYAARLDGLGATLSPGAFTVSTAANVQARAAVAWGGTSYLVAWEDYRNGATRDVYAARVNASGAILDTGGIAVSTALNDQYAPSVASNGTDFLVAWSDMRTSANGIDVYAARVNAAGAVLDAGGIAVSARLAEQSDPVVASDGAEYLVVWIDRREQTTMESDVYGARISGAGVVLDANGVPVARVAGQQLWPAVAYGGGGYLAAWSDASGAEVVAARVTTSGSVVDPGGFLVSMSANRQEVPAVAWNGQTWFVAWQDARNLAYSDTDLFGARLDAAGLLLDPTGIAIASAPERQADPAVSWDGASYLVAWSDRRNSTVGDGSDIYAARVSAAGELLDPDGVAVATGAGDQWLPAVASDGNASLVAWTVAASDGTGRLLATRVGKAGVVLDAAPVELATSCDGYDRSALARGADGFLATWTDLRDEGTGAFVHVYGARVSGAGTLLDPGGFRISPGTSAAFSPAVAWNGTTFLVAWSDNRTWETTGWDIYATRVSAEGVVLDGGGNAVTAVAGWQSSVSLAPDGAGFLAAWADGRAGSATSADLYGTRITGSAIAVSPGGLELALGAVTPAQVDAALPVPLAAGSPGRFLFSTWGFDADPDLQVARVKARTVEFALPSAASLSASTPEDTLLPITLGGNSPDGGPLSYAVVAPPSHGTLTGTPPAVTYVPAPNYAGTDSFTFRIDDGFWATPDATVSLTVTALPDAPAAAGQAVTTVEDEPVAITLVAADADGDALSWTVVAPPAHGALSGTPPNLTYTPATDYAGSDAFTFRVNDGALDSGVATVTLTISPVNDPPVATPMTLRVAPDTSLPITLAGTDPDANPLAFTVVEYPAHGTLTGIPPSLVYTPEAGYSGADAFTFRVNDGLLDSALATVSLTVRSAAAEVPTKSAYGCSSAGGSGGTLLLLALAGLALARVRRRPGAVLLALVAALPLAAQAAPAKEARLRVAVMPVRAGMGVEPKLAELVTDALVAELTDRGLLTITSKDVETALGFARQKQMLGCGDDTCLAEIAGAMGADRVVSGDIAQVRELTVFSVQLFNTKTGTVERRFHERMSGGEAADLLDATERAGEELFPGTVRAGRATRKKSVLTSAARPLALFARGGYDVSAPGGFGVVGLEYRMGRTLRLAVAGLGTGAQMYGGALRAGWYPLAFERLSIYGAAEAHLIFDDELLVAAHLALGAEWAFSERFAMSVEVPLTLMASAPEEYEGTYFMPGLSASWRF